MVLMWLPMVVHSAPLMIPMALTDRIVKKRSRSARSFQFLFIVTGDQSAIERSEINGDWVPKVAKGTSLSASCRIGWKVNLRMTERTQR